MPKKTRKMKQRAAERRSMQPVVPQESPAAMPGAPATEAPARLRSNLAAARTVTPLTFDYSHIYSDLKRIALFAGFFFAVLIILSFVIK